MRNTTYRWPVGMWERVKGMLDSGNSYKFVSAELGIPEHSLHSKAKWENMSPETKAKKNLRSKGYRDALRKKPRVRPYEAEMSPPRLQFERAIIRPSAELLAERDHRLSLEPRDLTAALLGDPPPGYSALERRA